MIAHVGILIGARPVLVFSISKNSLQIYRHSGQYWKSAHSSHRSAASHVVVFYFRF